MADDGKNGTPACARPRYEPGGAPSRIATSDAFRRLAADPAWRLPGEDAGRIDLVLAYLARFDEPAPGGVRGDEALEDTVAVRLAREALAAELRDYADFCRFREAEAAVAGVPVARVETDRRDWLAWKRTVQDIEAARGVERLGLHDGLEVAASSDR